MIANNGKDVYSKKIAKRMIKTASKLMTVMLQTQF